jgi:tetratricopeptide (TPR) repeat protein
MSQALRGVYGFGLKGLWRAWKKALKTRGLKTHPGLVQISLKFKRPGAEEGAEEEQDYDTIEEKRAKDFAHLGELLRAKGRFKGALSEYRKAITIGGDGNPLIQNGAAAAMLNLGMEKEVPHTLERVLRYYPDALKTHLHLGEAYLKLENPKQAIDSFESASGINPFHPRPYAALETLYRTMGRPEDADRVRKTMEILR